jgi:hypothetical protein
MPCRFLLMLAVLSSSGSALQAQSVLQWNFKPGEKLRYRLTRDQSTARMTGGAKSQESVQATTDMTLAVDDAAKDGTATITLRIDQIRYQKKSPEGDVRYDSKSDAAPTGLEPKLATNLKEFLSSEFTFKMTAQGEIKEIARKGAHVPLNAAIAKGIRNLLPYLLLPAEPVRAGKTWQEQTDYVEPVLGRRKVDITYRYLRPEMYQGQQVEKIGVAEDVRFVALPKSRISVGIKHNACTGAVLFDKAAGRLVAKEVKEKLSLVLVEAGQRTDQETDTTVTIKLNP